MYSTETKLWSGLVIKAKVYTGAPQETRCFAEPFRPVPLAHNAHQCGGAIIGIFNQPQRRNAGMRRQKKSKKQCLEWVVFKFDLVLIFL